jgi:hypothetical protein
VGPQLEKPTSIQLERVANMRELLEGWDGSSKSYIRPLDSLVEVGMESFNKPCTHHVEASGPVAKFPLMITRNQNAISVHSSSHCGFCLAFVAVNGLNILVTVRSLSSRNVQTD